MIFKVKKNIFLLPRPISISVMAEVWAINLRMDWPTCTFELSIIVFQKTPGFLSIIGSLAICIAVLSASFKKCLDNLPQEHTLKRNPILLCLYSKTCC